MIVTDTFGRPWRAGLVNVAIGCAGLPALIDLRGTPDAMGRERGNHRGREGRDVEEELESGASLKSGSGEYPTSRRGKVKTGI